MFGVLPFVYRFHVPAFAHHGTSGYDLEKIVTVNGTVASFEWSQSARVVHITSKNDKGEAAEWTIELGAPGIMARQGWSKNSMKPGDEVIAETHPAKNGATFGPERDLFDSAEVHRQWAAVTVALSRESGGHAARASHCELRK